MSSIKLNERLLEQRWTLRDKTVPSAEWALLPSLSKLTFRKPAASTLLCPGNGELFVTWHVQLNISLPYLSEVAGHFDIMPRVVVELPVDWLHDGFEGSRTQVDNEGDRSVLQRQVDVVSWLAGVKDKAVTLPGLEGERDLVAAALDGVLGEIVAEVLWTSEGGHVLLPGCGEKKKKKKRCRKHFSHPTVWTAWCQCIKGFQGRLFDSSRKLFFRIFKPEYQNLSLR